MNMVPGNTTINIINVPSDVGSVYAGKSRGPAAFKSAGLHTKLSASGFHVTETTALVNVEGGKWVPSSREPNGARNEAQTVEACQRVKEAVASALKNDAGLPFQLMLSGECLYCPAIMSAYWDRIGPEEKRIGILYVDGDCDLSTPAEPHSTGNIAGMTMTHLTLRGGALESMRAFCRPRAQGVVDNENVVLFGLNIDSSANQRPHLGYLFDHGFRVFTSSAVQQAPAEQATMALKWLEERVDYILVHIDVDVIDPGLFPLGNVANWTGLGFEETMVAVKTFLKSDKVVGLSIAEVNADHDPGLHMVGRLVDEVVMGLRGKHYN